MSMLILSLMMAQLTQAALNSPEFDNFLDEMTRGEVLNVSAHSVDPLHPENRPLQQSRQNRVDVLVDGIELRPAALETIRNAKKFIHFSTLDYRNDRIGRVIAEHFIAKKLGYDPEEFHQIALREGWLKDSDQNSRWELGKQIRKIQLYYTSEKLGLQLDPKISQTQLDQIVQKATRNFEIRMYLDFTNSWLTSFIQGKSPDKFGSRKSIVGTLRAFGIEVVYNLPLVFGWFNNHVKLVASESEAVVSGGNLMDKVVAWNPEQLEWHDMAIRVQGPAVDEINRFFLSAYNRFTDFAFNIAFSQPADVYKRDENGHFFYFPVSNEIPVGEAVIRPTYTTNYKLGVGSSYKVFKAALTSAKSLVLIETAFFSGQGIKNDLIDKARAWNLASLKLGHGESIEEATCDLEKIRARGKGIVVIVPKYHDQPGIRLATASFVNALLHAGIDLCNWTGDKFNQQTRDLPPSAKVKTYRSKTMMHSKVWYMDGELASIGTANLTSRSQAGDLELGLVLSDRESVQRVFESVFEPDIRNSEPSRARFMNKLAGIGNLFLFWTYLF